LTVGQTVRLVVQITDANGTLLTGRAFTFRSSSVAVAQVASDGTVTAFSPGAATITVTSDAQVGTATIVVSPSAVAAVRISPETPTLLVGATSRVSAVALDADGATLPQRPVVWTSGAPSVFTVGSDGTVVGVRQGAGLLLASSEGRLGSAAVIVRLPAVTLVELTPKNVSIIAGQTSDLTAAVLDSSGAAVTGRIIDWRSGNVAVAVVSNTGRVRAIAPGSTVMSATVDGVVGSTAVTVIPASVASVRVSFGGASVVVGDTTRATAELVDASNNVLSGRAVSWSSSNTAVATVNSSGLVTALGAGTATITATSEGQTGRADLTVTP
jgi:uncharacterized protein YjdB